MYPMMFDGLPLFFTDLCVLGKMPLGYKLLTSVERTVQ